MGGVRTIRHRPCCRPSSRASTPATMRSQRSPANAKASSMANVDLACERSRSRLARAEVARAHRRFGNLERRRGLLDASSPRSRAARTRCETRRATVDAALEQAARFARASRRLGLFGRRFAMITSAASLSSFRLAVQLEYLGAAPALAQPRRSPRWRRCAPARSTASPRRESSPIARYASR